LSSASEPIKVLAIKSIMNEMSSPEIIMEDILVKYPNFTLNEEK